MTHLHTIQTAAQSLSLPRAHVERLVRRGEIKSVHIGNRRLIHPDALRQFARRQTRITFRDALREAFANG